MNPNNPSRHQRLDRVLARLFAWFKAGSSWTPAQQPLPSSIPEAVALPQDKGVLSVSVSTYDAEGRLLSQREDLPGPTPPLPFPHQTAYSYD